MFQHLYRFPLVLIMDRAHIVLTGQVEELMRLSLALYIESLELSLLRLVNIDRWLKIE